MCCHGYDTPNLAVLSPLSSFRLWSLLCEELLPAVAVLVQNNNYAHEDKDQCRLKKKKTRDYTRYRYHSSAEGSCCFTFHVTC